MSSSTSSPAPTSKNRIMIINAEKFGLSPAERTFDITWVGTLTYANLHIDFGTSFGYGLSDAYLNGTKCAIKDPSTLDADVRFLLKQGSNKLTVDFAALQILGQPLGSTTISAYIDYYGASLLQVPSVSQTLTNLANDVKGNVGTVIAIGLIAVVGLASLAFISSRLPSAGNMKLSDIDVSKHVNKAKEGISNAANFGHSKIRHVIMSVRGQ